MNEIAVNTLEGQTSGKAKEYSRFVVKDISFNEFYDTTVCSGLVLFMHLSVFGIMSQSGVGVICLKAANKMGIDNISSLGIQ